MWATLLPYLKQILEHVVAGLVAAAVLYSTGAHTTPELVSAFMVGAGLSAKPSNVLK